MAYELEGILKVVMDAQTFGSGFTKREFVVTVGEDRYPQDIKLEFVKDKCSLLDRYQPGHKVKVGFDIRGGEHNGRYYVNLQAWRIHPAEGEEGGDSGGTVAAASAPAPSYQRPQGNPGGGGGGGERKFTGGGVGGGGKPNWNDKPKGGGGGNFDKPRGGGRPRPEGGDDGFRGKRGFKQNNDEDDIDF